MSGQTVTFNEPPPVGVDHEALAAFLAHLGAREGAQDIVYAARQYKAALELIEQRPATAYLALVSVVETLAAIRHPACRRREARSGCRMERENLLPTQCKGTSRKRLQPRGREYRCGRRDGAARSSVEGSLMGLERRGRVVQPRSRPTGNRRSPASEAKPFKIPKRVVWEAFKRAKANQGAAGVGGQSIVEFEAHLRKTSHALEPAVLWKLFSSAGAAGRIPKANGGTRPLGIPTVADRVAQEVAEDGCRQRGFICATHQSKARRTIPTRAGMRAGRRIRYS